MRLLFSIISLYLLLITTRLFAQTPPSIEWEKSLGGTGSDNGYGVANTSDGGYLISGYSNSNDGDVTGNHGGDDAWIAKLDEGGNMVWQKSYGGSKTDQAFEIIQTTDGNYVFVGESSSSDGDLTNNKGALDYWIVKIDTNQQILWEKNYGGSQSERAQSVVQTSDGGYAMMGFTASGDQDVSGHHDSSDYWLVRLDSQGEMLWQKCLGGSGADWGSSVKQLTDGGYVVAGRCRSNDGDVTGNHGDYDVWIARLDSSGNIIWQKSFGGSIDEDDAYAIPTGDGGFIIGAITKSTDGDVTGNHGDDDYWVLRLNSDGDLLWEKCYGGCCDDDDYDIEKTSDGNYIVAGHAFSDDQQVTNHWGGSDYWLIKIDSLGNLLWQKDMGGSDGPLGDGGETAKETPDGGYIMVGRSDSNDGDVTGNHGGLDYWVVKLSTATGLHEAQEASVNIFPQPATDFLYVSFQKITDRNLQTTISDLLGRKVYSASVAANRQNEFEVDVSAFTPGIYFIDLKMGSETFQQKFLVAR